MPCTTNAIVESPMRSPLLLPDTQAADRRSRSRKAASSASHVSQVCIYPFSQYEYKSAHRFLRVFFILTPHLTFTPRTDIQTSINQKMQLTFLAALLPLLSIVSAAPALNISPRNCASIPSTANAGVRNQVYQIATSRKVTAKVLLSTFEVRISSEITLFKTHDLTANFLSQLRRHGSNHM